mmetsp:Transcript_2660/g.6345  ORF Transcript_2660/g.6345 Transcript_2660/m.6345 type:complete len:205 (-) Transcript_2660:542-1156(-)
MYHSRSYQKVFWSSFSLNHHNLQHLFFLKTSERHRRLTRPTEDGTGISAQTSLSRSSLTSRNDDVEGGRGSGSVLVEQEIRCILDRDIEQEVVVAVDLVCLVALAFLLLPTEFHHNRYNLAFHRRLLSWSLHSKQLDCLHQPVLLLLLLLLLDLRRLALERSFPLLEHPPFFHASLRQHLWQRPLSAQGRACFLRLHLVLLLLY